MGEADPIIFMSVTTTKISIGGPGGGGKPNHPLVRVAVFESEVTVKALALVNRSQERRG